MSEDCPHCLYDKTHENCPGCWEGSHYRPKPSAPRRIHSPVDHYDVDVATGTVMYHVVTTNADRIRAMTDDELTRFFAENCGCGDWCMHHRSGACANKPENECCLDVWHRWLKSPADEVSE